MNNRIAKVVPKQDPTGKVKLQDSSKVKGGISAPAIGYREDSRCSNAFYNSRVAIQTRAKVSKNPEPIPTLSALKSDEGLRKIASLVPCLQIRGTKGRGFDFCIKGKMASKIPAKSAANFSLVLSVDRNRIWNSQVGEQRANLESRGFFLRPADGYAYETDDRENSPPHKHRRARNCKVPQWIN